MKVQLVTKVDAVSGSAYSGWSAESDFGKIGGDYLTLVAHNRKDDDPVSLVALLGDRPVGKINLLKGAIEADGESVEIYWGSGLEVLEEHRRSGAGVALLAALRRLMPAMGAVSISIEALPLYLKMGWTCFEAPRYVLLRKAVLVGDWFASGKSQILRRALALAAAPAVAIHEAWVRTRVAWLTRSIIVERVERVPAEFSGLLPLRSSKRYRTARTVESLEGVLSLGPKENDRTLYVVRNAAGDLKGYFIASCALRDRVAGGRLANVKVASLRDWASFDHRQLPEITLIAAGISALLGRASDVIEICVPEKHELPGRTYLGLVHLGSLQFILRCNGPVAPLNTSAVHDQRNWWFRPGDGDAFLL